MSEDSVILIDIPNGEAADVGFLQGLGHSVMVCHGPDPGTLCPILSGTGCPMVDEAHGIVFLLDLDRPQHRAILKRYKDVVKDDVPIRVKVSREQAVSYADMLRGVQVWTHDPGVGDLDGFSAEVDAADMFRE